MTLWRYCKSLEITWRFLFFILQILIWYIFGEIFCSFGPNAAGQECQKYQKKTKNFPKSMKMVLWKSSTDLILSQVHLFLTPLSRFTPWSCTFVQDVIKIASYFPKLGCKNILKDRSCQSREAALWFIFV